jgi:hypothetical protein
MRKRGLAMIMVLLVLFQIGCTPQAVNNEDISFFGSGTAATATIPDTTPTVVPTETPADVQWTVMIYMNGSNLESENGEATTNLESLLSVHIPENIRVLVYTGGTARWQKYGISSGANQIWLARDGGLELLESLSRKNMGSSATLAEFIAYGQQYAPYERKALILWDHGGGSVQGFGADEWYDYDGLFLYEMADAMEAGYDGVPFDLIGFDACLMASIETASVFAPYAQVLVASEEVEPGGGWDYRSVFNQLALQPQMTGEELGIAIADSYYGKYKLTPTEGYITCSVIDLAAIPELEQRLGEFSQGLSGSIAAPAAMQTLAYARQNSESYGDEPGAVSFDMIDLYHFVNQQTNADGQLAAALKSAIEEAVVYEVSGSQRMYSYGLSIYFPFAAKDYFDYCLDIYDDLNFCPEYQTFIVDFAGCLTDPVYTQEVPEYAETALFETPDIGQSGSFSKLGSYYVELTDAQLEYLGYVYCTLGLYIDDDMLIDLGDDSDITIEYTDTGVIIRDDFEHAWTGLCGQPVALYILEETDNYLIYNIPIMYNGQRAVVKAAWIWDESYSENGVYVINGVFLSNDQTVMPDTRMEVTVQPGDVIAPIYQIYSYDGYTGYYEGDSVTVTASGLYLDIIWLPDGVYQYGFKFIDVYGNVYYSELVDIPVDN